MKIYFDTASIPENPTLILANRAGEKLGKIEAQALKVKDSLNESSELYFEVHKYINGQEELLWNEIDNLKLIWCKENNIWFDVQININESTDVIKTVTCKGLGHSELSQIYLYETEINTEADISRDDYEITVLYDGNNPQRSLLNRILNDKAPHYSIGRVDASIQEIQRTFSFNGITICDAFNEIAEEIECIFDIHITSDENGNIQRIINVYDLLNYCTKCGHREENITVCPKCGSSNILPGYGEDTTIFVTSDELANEISFDSDVDSVKNCFRLTAGDDVITSAVRDCNPNGSSYIWYIPEYMRKEMSEELQNKLAEYDIKYNQYQNNDTDTSLIKNICDRQKILSHCAIYANKTICTLMGRKYYAVCLNDEGGFAIGGWVSIPDANKKYWNLPLICTPHASSWRYYYYDKESDKGNEANKREVDQTIVVNGTTWYYNGNHASISGDTGNRSGTGIYLGCFNSMKEAARLLITEYYNGNSYNLLAYKYNSLLSRYENKNAISENNKHKNIPVIPKIIYNYPQLMEAYYNTIDMKLFLESTLSPTVNIEEIDNGIDRQAEIIRNLNNIGAVANFAVQNKELRSVSDDTLLISAKNYIKYHIGSNYKLEVAAGNNFRTDSDTTIAINVDVTIEPYSSLSEEETQTISGIRLVVNNDYETYIRSRIDATLADVENEDGTDISSLFKMDNEYEFQYILMFYSYNRLQSFADACQSCLDILISQGANSNNNSDIYENIYLPYYNKGIYINNELIRRNSEIKSIAQCNENGELYSGIQNEIVKERDKIRILLNFQNFISKESPELWKEFCTYRREYEYNNDNYISDGLSNAEVLEKALGFIQKATQEIHKSAVVQHTISTTLKNLLVIKKFEPLVEYFEVGNWIRVQIDGVVYKLRLVSYEIDYSNLNNISVEFSDVTTSIDGYTDIQNIISRAESMASSYDYVARQAERGEEGKKILNNWVETGLDATNVKFIGGADNQTQTWDEHGMLFKAYNPLDDSYDDRQLKIINNTIAITNDNWKHIRTAVGRFLYKDPENNNLIEAYGVNGETIVGKLILGERLGIYNSKSTLQFNGNGLSVKSNVSNNDISVYINPNDSSVFKIQKENSNNEISNIFYVDENGNGVFNGTINAVSGSIGGWSIGENRIYDISGRSNGVSNACVGINKYGLGMAFYAGATNDTTGNNALFKVDHEGNLTATSANITGTINATSGIIGGWSICPNNIFCCVDNYYSGLNKPNTGMAFFAGSYGDSNGYNGNFRVAHDGSLYASNANITGTITATSGSFTGIVNATRGIIGHWDISEVGLTSRAYIWLNHGEYGDTSGGARIYRYGLQSYNGGNANGTYQNLNHPLLYVIQQAYNESTGWADEKITMYISPSGLIYAQNLQIEGNLYLNGMQFAALSTGHNGSTAIRDTLICSGAYVVQTWDVKGGSENWYNQYYDCNKVYISSVANTSLEMNGDIKTNGVNAASDERYKDLYELNDKYETFFNHLKPLLYVYKLPNQSFHRKHLGFGAQSVEKALKSADIDTEDFAGLVIEKDAIVNSVLNKDGTIEQIKTDELYQLRYTEFIALNTYMIQKTRKQLLSALETIKQLQNEINELKAMVN